MTKQNFAAIIEQVSGDTQADKAKALGIGAGTLSKALNEGPTEYVQNKVADYLQAEADKHDGKAPAKKPAKAEKKAKAAKADEQRPRANAKGLVSSRRAQETGHVATVYVAEDAGLDVGEDNKYATVCEAHGTMVGSASLKGAKAARRHPLTFCDACRKEQKAAKK